MNQINLRVGLNGARLKWCAIVLMLVDHIGVVLIWPLVTAGSSLPFLGMGQKGFLTLYYVCRLLGRTAFPVFGFLLVEGLLHTHSRAGYLVRLAVFALLSEVPFDLAISGQVFSLDNQNVFCTLLIAGLTIRVYEYITQKALEANQTLLVTQITRIAAVMVMAYIAQMLHTDYGMVGVAAIFVMYIYQAKNQPFMGAFMGWLVLSLSMWIELFSFPFLGLVWCYNGQRGRQNKYFFYIFYPAHLLLLVGLKILFLT